MLLPLTAILFVISIEFSDLPLAPAQIMIVIGAAGAAAEALPAAFIISFAAKSALPVAALVIALETTIAMLAAIMASATALAAGTIAVAALIASSAFVPVVIEPGANFFADSAEEAAIIVAVAVPIE